MVLYIHKGVIMYTVYKATHRPTGKFYVGYTQQELQCRIGQHWGLQPAKRRTFNHFLHSTKLEDWNWEILKTVNSYKEARDCEMYYIRQLDAYECGLNESTGLGASTLQNRKTASERMKAYKAANPEPWNKGRKGIYSQETLDAMSLAKLKNPSKKVYSQEKKDVRSLESKNSKEIIEMTTHKTYRSISHAARELGMRRESIRDCVNGRRRHTAGKVFMEFDKYVEMCKLVAARFG